MHRKVSVIGPVFASVVAIALLAFGVPAVAEQAAASAKADGVIAFYFHGDVRCTTCRTIEAYAEEAVNEGFADQLASGSLEWRVVNVEKPENEHFVEDFQLVTRSVVLVEYRDGKVMRWRILDKVWQLVRSKERFVEYVQSEVGEFIGTR